MKRWFTVVVLATLVVIALTSCGGPPPPSPTQATQASPSPTPTLPPSPTPKPSPSPTPTPSPSPTQTPPSPGQLPNVLPYPNAKETVKVTTEGSGPEGQNGTVVYTSLETTDTYEAVKAYYEKQVPPGWKNVGSFENTDENGDRTFTISTQNPDGTAWFIFSIMEQKADGKVIISHNVGTEGSASAQPADTGPLKPYPNATVVSSSSWTGMGGNGKEGKWTAVILSTTDSYEQVK
ncbi:MAG: hypothetical protein NTV14_07340, partial [Coprothermobacterota bacterium]|nr:hypothetical protein [Coprothermobacterota bacterium]